MNKGGGVQREGVELRFYLTFFRPRTGERIAVGTLQRKHPVLEHPKFVERLGVRRGKVDVPLAVNVVQFRRPDQLAHRAGLGFAPDHNFFSFT